MTKIRVDALFLREHLRSSDQLRLEKFLQGLADEGWELLQMFQLEDGYILTVHRKVTPWWKL